MYRVRNVCVRYRFLMPLPIFTESKACRSEQHCRTCRDLDGGRAWRGKLAAAFALPADAPDFACPHGKGWGHSVPPPVPEVPSRGLGDTVAKVLKRVGIKPCGGCKKRQERLNKLLPY